MTRHTHKLEAAMHDHILRWHVTSASRPEIRHTVDLGAWNGFGECSCENFQFNKLPTLARGGTVEARCKHILCARQAFTDTTIAMLVKKNQRKDQWHNER